MRHSSLGTGDSLDQDEVALINTFRTATSSGEVNRAFAPDLVSERPLTGSGLILSARSNIPPVK